MSYCHHLASVVNISIFSSETIGPFGTKLGRNISWVDLYKVFIFGGSKLGLIFRTISFNNIFFKCRKKQRKTPQTWIMYKMGRNFLGVIIWQDASLCKQFIDLQLVKSFQICNLIFSLNLTL